MRIQFNPSLNTYNNPVFTSSARRYFNDDGYYIGTNTWLFREDINWRQLAEFEKKHFKDKEKVNVIQFAASDGSEAYTKIMSILENNPSPDDKKFFPIQAYDIDSEIINAAKSNYLNTCTNDRMSLQMYTENPDKYFKKCEHTLELTNDQSAYLMKTMYVQNTLKSRVEFHNKDMYKVLENLKDNSDTILMCRNILGYFDENVIEDFIVTVSEKLKQNSLFIIGDHDTRVSNIKDYLRINNFIDVMKNVYKKL